MLGVQCGLGYWAESLNGYNEEQGALPDQIKETKNRLTASHASQVDKGSTPTPARIAACVCACMSLRMLYMKALQIFCPGWFLRADVCVLRKQKLVWSGSWPPQGPSGTQVAFRSQDRTATLEEICRSHPKSSWSAEALISSSCCPDVLFLAVA